jgi:hypothetical protein
MSVDSRPKYMNFLAKLLVDRRTQTSFWSKPFVTTDDLLFLEALAFERCGILGTLCQDTEIPFFRVLAVLEGCEDEGIAVIGKMSEDSVLPFVDESLGTLDLLFRSVSSKIKFDGEFSDFRLKHGKEKLPVDKAGVSISVWASMGGYIGLEYPDFIERLLRWTYGTPEDLGFTAEQSRIIETGLGKNPYSIADVEREAIQLFSEFCKEYYPKEAKQFPFIH